MIILVPAKYDYMLDQEYVNVVFPLIGEANCRAWLRAKEDGIEGRELRVLCFDLRADFDVVEALSGRVDGVRYRKRKPPPDNLRVRFALELRDRFDALWGLFSVDEAVEYFS